MPAGIYTLTTVNNITFGEPSGLPAITTLVTIDGAGAAATVIERSTAGGTPDFRIFLVLGPGALTLSNVTLRNGRAPRGGAIHTNANVTIKNSILMDNSAGSLGGAVSFLGPALTIDNSTFTGNFAGSGGAISHGGVLTVTKSTFTGNRADVRGGVTAGGSGATLNMSDSIVSDNSADSDGGAIYGGGGNTTVTNSTIARNSSGGHGGGVRALTLVMTDSTVVDNTAITSGGGIGIVATAGASANITGSTISGNSAGTSGGGISSKNLTITNSTVSGNRARNSGGGIATGGLGDSFSSNNVTITNNIANTGNSGGYSGGGILFAALSTLRNSIIAGNFVASVGTGPDCATNGPATSQGFNLIGNNCGCDIPPVAGDQIGTANSPIDAHLGPLQDNGGATWTHAPLPGSPAIDAGSPNPPGSGAPACAATDQRGGARAADGNNDGSSVCDTGAVEVGALVIPDKPQFTLAAFVAKETDGIATVTVTRADGSGEAHLAYATRSGSATAGADYLPASGTLDFLVGELEKSFEVTILDDAIGEATESVELELTDPATGGAVMSTAVLFIKDDETVPLLAVDDVSVLEGQSGVANAVFTVRLSRAYSFPVTVRYSTTNGTATAGEDYVATMGVLTIGVGGTSGSFAVPINGDALVEPDETFTVNLATSIGCITEFEQATGVIRNDDVTNAPPAVTNPGNQMSAEGATVALGISASDPDGDALTYSATGLPPGLSINAAGVISGTLGYTAAATYTPTVTVTDAKGASASTSFMWTVTDVNRPPVVTNPGNQMSAEGTSVSLQISASDPDGDALSYSAAGLPPGLSINATGLISGSLDYNSAGTYNVTVSVTDTNGATTSTSFTWTVTNTNRPPTANPQSVATAEDTAVGITLTGSDPDGDSLTFTVTSGPAHGTLAGTVATWTYTPNLNYNGADSFTYTVSDGAATSAPATVTISVTPVNDPPVAPSDSYSINEDATLAVAAPGVLGNDSDVDSPSLTAALMAGPTNGTLTLNSNGSFTYTPNANFFGTDSFTYKANDGQADSNLATVTITVNAVNDSPTANNQTVTTPEDAPVLITLTGSDIEGNDLGFQVTVPPSHGTLAGLTVTGPTTATVIYTPDPNYSGPDSFLFIVNDGTANSPEATISISVTPVNDGPMANDQTINTHEDVAVPITLTGSDPEGNPLTFTIETQPITGTLSGTPPNLAYIPNANFNGTDSFTFSVSDGSLTSAPATVAITVEAVNDAPTATGFSASTQQNTPVTLTLLGSDPESDPLTFNIVTEPANGSLGLVVGNNVTYTPNLNFTGLDSLSFTVSDGSSISAPATVLITVTSGQFKCPLTQGYWKTHPEAWLTTFLVLGSQSYTKAELLTLLNTPVKGDASLILAHQLIAAKLNIANGSDPAPISSTIAHADSLLGGFSGKLPYNVKTSTTTGKAMVNEASVLDSYNNSQLTPGCVP